MKNEAIIDCSQCKSRRDSVFCELEGTQIKELNNQKTFSTYKKGQLIFKQGFYPNGIYCIQSGKVKLSQLSENGREQIVRLAKSGDLLGYRSILGGEKYSSSAEAIEESQICFITKDVFFNFLKHNGSLSLEVMKLVARDLRNAEHKVTDLAQKPVKERMAGALIYLKETYGLEPDGQTLNVVLRREDIANIAGTATETAIRILADIKHEGYIGFDGKKIRIVKAKELLQLANLSD